MDAVPLYPASQAAVVIARTGKVLMQRLLLDSHFAFAESRNAAVLLVAGRSKQSCSVTIVDRLPVIAIEKIAHGYSLRTKTLLEMIDPFQCLAALQDNREMRSVEYSSPEERLRFADRTHLGPGFDSSWQHTLVGLTLD